MNISQMLGNDPEVLRYQLMQQELQRYNQYQDPRMNLASTLGGLLGGGLVNWGQGRGFFESNNPVLRKASDLQRIYNETASSIDPNTNPGDFYKTLQQNLAAAGYGQQAAMAAQEAYKYTQEDKKLELQTRQVAAAEKKAIGKSPTALVTEKGLPISFDEGTGSYFVGREEYDVEKHGGIREKLDPMSRFMQNQGGGTPSATAPKGGKDTRELTDEEKRRIFNEGRTGTTNQAKSNPADEYIGKSYGPNTPDAVLVVGVKEGNKQAEAEYARRLDRQAANNAATINNPYGF